MSVCRTFISTHPRGTALTEGGGSVPTVIQGHDPKLKEILLRTRTDVAREDYYYQTHPCERCGEILALTVGEFSAVRRVVGGGDK